MAKVYSQSVAWRVTVPSIDSKPAFVRATSRSKARHLTFLYASEAWPGTKFMDVKSVRRAPEFDELVWTGCVSEDYLTRD